MLSEHSHGVCCCKSLVFLVLLSGGGGGGGGGWVLGMYRCTCAVVAEWGGVGGGGWGVGAGYVCMYRCTCAVVAEWRGAGGGWVLGMCVCTGVRVLLCLQARSRPRGRC